MTTRRYDQEQVPTMFPKMESCYIIFSLSKSAIISTRLDKHTDLICETVTQKSLQRMIPISKALMSTELHRIPRDENKVIIESHGIMSKRITSGRAATQHHRSSGE